MRKLFVDLDNTYLNTMKQIVNMYNSDYCYYSGYKEVKWQQIKSWSFKECHLIDDKSEVNKYFTQKRFFDGVESMPDAEMALVRLTEFYEIIFVSMGAQPNLKGKEKYVLQLPFDADFIGCDWNYYTDKSHIDMSNGIFIDDMTRYLTTSNAAVKICFGKSFDWNKDWKGNKYESWAELESYLLAQAKLLKEN